jgi:ribose-phosphate pyrophosphokinase
MKIDTIIGDEKDGFMRNIAGITGSEFLDVEERLFPDNEFKIIINPGKSGVEKIGLKDYLMDIKGKNVLFGLRDDRFSPNPSRYFLKNLMTLGAINASEPRKLFFVVPYLQFSRQERASVPGEGVTLDDIVDAYKPKKIDHFLTVTSHLYGKIGYQSLQSMFQAGRPPREVTFVHDLGAEKVFYDALVKDYNVKDPVVVGPDTGTINMVKKLADLFDSQYTFFSKKRTTKGGVIDSIQAPIDIHEVKGRDTIIIDDVTATGNTLYAACSALETYRPGRVFIAVVHLVGFDAVQKLSNLYYDNIFGIYTTDSLRTSFEGSIYDRYIKEVSISPIISNAIDDWFEEFDE